MSTTWSDDGKSVADLLMENQVPEIRAARAKEAAQWVTLTRQAPVELHEGDGRTLVGRVVPYNVVADVADPPTWQPYKESFAPGAFNAQLTAANRIDVLLNYEHRQGISDVVGRGVSLDERPDGLYGTFRMLSHGDGDKALELYHAGVLRGLSTEFAVRKSRTVDGVVQRVDARIGNVALCREHGSPFGGAKAAYAGAEVLSVRTDAEATESDGEATPAPTGVGLPLVQPLDWERLGGVGIEPISTAAVVRKPWNPAPERFTPEEYQRACLVEGLPVLEPDGAVNVNALAVAAGRLRQVEVTGAERAAAARKLKRYYVLAGLKPPATITNMAGQ